MVQADWRGKAAALVMRPSMGRRESCVPGQLHWGGKGWIGAGDVEDFARMSMCYSQADHLHTYPEDCFRTLPVSRSSVLVPAAFGPARWQHLEVLGGGIE